MALEDSEKNALRIAMASKVHADGVIDELENPQSPSITSPSILNALSLEAGTAAAAGSVQGDATALGSAAIVHVVTGGNDTTGVILPSAAAGDVKVVLNSGSAGLKIYPATSDKINNGSANAAITILENTMAILVATAADNWGAIFTANS